MEALPLPSIFRNTSFSQKLIKLIWKILSERDLFFYYFYLAEYEITSITVFCIANKHNSLNRNVWSWQILYHL